MKRLVLAAALLACGPAVHAEALPGQGSWQTTLQARNLHGHAVALDSAQAAFFYDSVLDVTWLRQASAPQAQSWSQARDWAGGLQVGRFDDWRLPTTLDTGLPGCSRITFDGGDCGYNVPAGAPGAYSEMAHLFQVTLGNATAYTTAGQFRGWDGQGHSWGLANTAGFTGLQPGNYWSGSAVAGSPNYAWSYHLGLGMQSLGEKGVAMQALVLRNGDVLSPVPEPSTWAMAAAGLLTLGWLQRRRGQRNACAMAC